MKYNRSKSEDSKNKEQPSSVNKRQGKKWGPLEKIGLKAREQECQLR